MLTWRAHVGLIVPIDNRIIEPELNHVAPDGVAINAARLHTMALPEMPADAEAEADNLARMGADVIAYACNASSFYDGPGGDEAIADRLAAVADRPVTTASTAMVRALEEIGAESIAVVTPYDRADNERLEGFLDGNGFDVVALSGLGLAADEAEDLDAVNDVSAFDTYRHVKATDREDADAVLVTATNLASVETLETMEDDLGKPVVSTNQAMLWHALTLARIRPSVPGFGTLLS